MNNYYYELIETQFDNHKDPEITERVIGKYRDFDPARIAGYKLAKELEESERFKGWRFDHNNILETSVIFLAEKYNKETTTTHPRTHAQTSTYGDDVSFAVEHFMDGSQHVLQSIGSVGIVDDGGEAFGRLDGFQTSADAVECA